MYLFFDTSAIGNPKSYKKPPTDPFNWPRMSHLSWLVYNEERELIASDNAIIKPEGWDILPDFERKHHLTGEEAHEKGVDLKEALLRFKKVIDDSEYIISHNMTYNEGIVGAEFYRKSIDHRLAASDKYCLMREAAWFTKIKGKEGRFKWPQLQDIHAKIFDARFADAGNAHTDVAVTAICFFHMLDLEAIELF